eukprot:5509157-Pleurochrysis_carterae.AAC.4
MPVAARARKNSIPPCTSLSETFAVRAPVQRVKRLLSTVPKNKACRIGSSTDHTRICRQLNRRLPEARKAGAVERNCGRSSGQGTRRCRRGHHRQHYMAYRLWLYFLCI